MPKYAKVTRPLIRSPCHRVNETRSPLLASRLFLGPKIIEVQASRIYVEYDEYVEYTVYCQLRPDIRNQTIESDKLASNDCARTVRPVG